MYPDHRFHCSVIHGFGQLPSRYAEKGTVKAHDEPGVIHSCVTYVLHVFFLHPSNPPMLPSASPDRILVTKNQVQRHRASPQNSFRNVKLMESASEKRIPDDSIEADDEHSTAV